MDPKELRGLYEAYSEVYAPQENIEEGLRSAVKRLLGGGKKEAEAPKPESRGEQLRKKYNVGPEKSDTSAKRQILDRSRTRAERDEKEFGGSKYSKSVAQKSKAAHDRYLKAGYSKYGADDARGSGNKARRRAAELNVEEFDWIVNTLLDEGYDLSTYTVDEFYDICLDEAVKGESSERRKDLAAERRAGHRPKSAKEGENYASHKLAQMAYVKRQRMGEEVEIFDVVLEFLQAEGYAETLEEAEWLMANVIDEEAISIVLGEAIYSEKGKAKAAEMIAKRSTPSGRAKSGKGANVAQIRQIRGSGRGHFDREGLGGTPMTPTMAKNPIKKQSYTGTGNKAARRAAALKNEEFELWVDALVEEGYNLSGYTWDEMFEIYLDEAEKPFPYEKVKAKQVALRDKGGNALDRRMKMGAAVRRAKEAEKTGGSQQSAGKGWYHAKEDYVNEAQEARNNPEKYEREQSKKYAPVRGEKTPMPPRGDKRREDFEKWYAANVR